MEFALRVTVPEVGYNWYKLQVVRGPGFGFSRQQQPGITMWVALLWFVHVIVTCRRGGSA